MSIFLTTRQYDQFTFFHSGPLSQWYQSHFELDGNRYVCAEQYMMAQKALLFNDTDAYEKILNSTNPFVHKQVGRAVKNYNDAEWGLNRERIVYNGNKAKFTQSDFLIAELINTRGTLLVEASSSDKIWGIGISMSDPARLDPRNWRGLNMLGRVLTKLREEFE